MRITDNMVMNNMLLNTMRNRQRLDKLNQQYSTLKKIQVPSDNPIIAARALRFRTNVSEIAQYKVNVHDGISWMSVSEQALYNTRSILDDMRERCIQGGGALETEDRNAIASELKQLRQQLTTEANVNYGGRYVFSGYKTDEKYIFDKKQENVKYEITEKFTGEDIKAMKVDMDTTVHRYRLGYDKLMPSGGISIYTKDPGDPDNLVVAKTLTLREVTLMEGKFVDSADPVNADGSPKEISFGTDEAFINKETGEIFFNMEDTDFTDLLNNDDLAHISFTYEKDNFTSGDINPIHVYDCTKTTYNADGTVADSQTYTSINETLDYSIGIGNKININTLGKNFLSNDLLRDVDELIAHIENFDPESIDRQPQGIPLSDRFNAMVGKLDKYMETLSREHSDVGSRMKRLELTKNRISEDEANFKALMSENEDVDLAEIIMLFNNQEMLYQASLMAGSKVIQPSLVDFIR